MARRAPSAFKLDPMARRGKAERVAVRLPEETAPEHWLRTIRLSGFTLLMLGLLILAIIVLAPNLRVFIEQRQQIAALQERVDAAEAMATALGSEAGKAVAADVPNYASGGVEMIHYPLSGDR